MELSATIWLALSPIIPRLLLLNPRGNHPICMASHGVIVDKDPVEILDGEV